MKGYASVILIGLLLFVFSPVHAQQIHHQQQNPVETPKIFRLIDRDMSQGRITKEDALLNKFYAVFDQKKLSSRYQKELTVTTNSAPSVLKCFTPTVLEYEKMKSSLSSGTKKIINSYLSSALTRIIEYILLHPVIFLSIIRQSTVPGMPFRPPILIMTDIPITWNGWAVMPIPPGIVK